MVSRLQALAENGAGLRDWMGVLLTGEWRKWNLPSRMHYSPSSTWRGKRSKNSSTPLWIHLPCGRRTNEGMHLGNQKNGETNNALTYCLDRRELGGAGCVGWDSSGDFLTLNALGAVQKPPTISVFRHTRP